MTSKKLPLLTEWTVCGAVGYTLPSRPRAMTQSLACPSAAAGEPCTGCSHQHRHQKKEYRALEMTGWSGLQIHCSGTPWVILLLSPRKQKTFLSLFFFLHNQLLIVYIGKREVPSQSQNDTGQTMPNIVQQFLYSPSSPKVPHFPPPIPPQPSAPLDDEPRQCT